MLLPTVLAAAGVGASAIAGEPTVAWLKQGSFDDAPRTPLRRNIEVSAALYFNGGGGRVAFTELHVGASRPTSRLTLPRWPENRGEGAGL